MTTPAPYRVLVTGSRDWNDTDTICDALDEATRGREATIVVGDCPTGADRIAYMWAAGAMAPIDVHRADWTAHGKAAGPIRNKAMVATNPDLCLAFIRNGSRGASHTARLAEQAGIPTRRWTA